MSSDTGFDNSGKGRLVVPGLDGVPVDICLREDCRFTANNTEWYLSPDLTARELTMLSAMNTITDQPNWHLNIHNDEIVATWQRAAMEDPLIDLNAWIWCVRELRDKSKHFVRSKGMLVFDTATAVHKLDQLEESHDLKVNAAHLLSLPTTPSNNQELHFVDPSLFPLVYGQTPGLTNGGCVELDNCLASYGRGETIPKPHVAYKASGIRRFGIMEGVNADLPAHAHHTWTLKDTGTLEASTKFQQLPCEVEFTGKSDTAVKITSCINNLHPIRFKSLYGSLEKVISTSIEPWNQVLIKENKGRTPRRINTWGIEWEQPPLPRWASRQIYTDALEELKNGSKPGSKPAVKQVIEYLGMSERVFMDRFTFRYWSPSAAIDEVSRLMTTEWRRKLKWKHPDAGKSYTYEEWKDGRTGRAIVKPAHTERPDPLRPYPGPDHEFYDISLQNTFRQKGLQVIFRISGIELDPSHSSYPGSVWQTEAMQNEHIVATTILFYDMENIQSNPRVFFRQPTYWPYQLDSREKRVDAMMAVFDIPDLEFLGDPTDEGIPPSNQNLGSILIREGRQLAWPSVLHHRIGSFELADKEKGGHLRYVVLHLVDPNYRIFSTRNVPLQRRDWWLEEASRPVAARLPKELYDQIERYTEGWPMNIEQATKLREEHLRERARAQSAVFRHGQV